jgi:hypothetical protein
MCESELLFLKQIIFARKSEFAGLSALSSEGNRTRFLLSLVTGMFLRLHQSRNPARAYSFHLVCRIILQCSVLAASVEEKKKWSRNAAPDPDMVSGAVYKPASQVTSLYINLRARRTEVYSVTSGTFACVERNVHFSGASATFAAFAWLKKTRKREDVRVFPFRWLLPFSKLVHYHVRPHVR